eukprot:c22087_g1_i2 orf=2-229(-)
MRKTSAQHTQPTTSRKKEAQNQSLSLPLDPRQLQHTAARETLSPPPSQQLPTHSSGVKERPTHPSHNKRIERGSTS